MLTRFCEEPAYWTPEYQYWYLGKKELRGCDKDCLP